METLRVIAPDLSVHHNTMIDLIAKTFSDQGYFWFRDYCTRGYIDHAHYDPAASRIGLIGDQIVTHFGVWRYAMRIGRARLTCGGIGVVATHADFRKRGLMEQTIPASIAAMRESGYDFSLLFGIPNFYHRFGYTRAWSESSYFVPAGEFPNGGKVPKREPFTPEPRDDLAAVYNRAMADVTGTAVRPTFQACFYPGRAWQGALWRDGRKRIAGYLFFTQAGSRLDVVEAIGATDEVLAVIGAEARDRDCGEVRFNRLPPRSELAHRLRHGTCRVETYHNRNGGAMIRTINLPQALEKMSGELESRLAASPLATWKGDLTVADAREAVRLRINRGKIAVSPARGRSAHEVRGGDAVAQLLLGTDAPGQVLDDYAITTRGDGRALAEALFPAQGPMLHEADRF